MLQTMAIPPAFNEKSSNFGPLTAWNYIEFGPTKMHLFGILYLGPYGVLFLKFLHALQIDQALLAHTTSGAGGPKNLIVKIKNLASNSAC